MQSDAMANVAEPIDELVELHFERAARGEVRPPLGWGRGTQPVDIIRAVRLSRDVGAALAVGLGLAGAVQWWRDRSAA